MSSQCIGGLDVSANGPAKYITYGSKECRFITTSHSVIQFEIWSKSLEELSYSRWSFGSCLELPTQSHPFQASFLSLRLPISSRQITFSTVTVARSISAVVS